MPDKIINYFSEKLHSTRLRLRMLCAVIGAVYITLCICIEPYMPMKPYRFALIAALGGLVLTALGLIIYDRVSAARLGKSKAAVGSADTSVLSGIQTEFIRNLAQPVLICDDSGRIAWYNHALASVIADADDGELAKENLRGMSISRLLSVGLESMRAETNDDGFVTTALGGFWRIRTYRYESKISGKYLNILVWHNIGELTQLREKMTAENPIVSYIVIDNLEELSQYSRAASQDGISDAAVEVRQILTEWARKSDGVIREYGQYRFLFVFSAQKLNEFTADKFGILDAVRSVRIGSDISLPVTVSIGIGTQDGSLAEKERSAQTALETALQRGGDQVVLKTESGFEFYGGRTRGVQKSTKVAARVVSEELAGLIAASSNVLLMCHRWADFDAIGSCVGVARLAMYCGVKVNIVVNFGDPNISGCLELLSVLPEYSSVFIDAASAQDLISSGTLLVICDVNNPAQFEAPDLARNCSSVAIVDHHRRTVSPEFDDGSLALSYIDPAASSACEMVTEILGLAMPQSTVGAPGGLTPQEAEVILAGILVDTKQFSRNVSTRTFSAALWLRGAGADVGTVQSLFKTDIVDFASEADFESNVFVYRGFIAIAKSDYEGLKTRLGGSAASVSAYRIAAAKSADRMLGIRGIRASFAICRIDKLVHISARSDGTVNVQLIMEKLGGGGHFDGAAVQLDKDLRQAQEALKQAIDEYLEGLE